MYMLVLAYVTWCASCVPVIASTGVWIVVISIQGVGLTCGTARIVEHRVDVGAAEGGNRVGDSRRFGLSSRSRCCWS